MTAPSLQGTVSPMSLTTAFDINARSSVSEVVPPKSRSPTSTASSAGSKRKRAGEPKFYAVKVGHNPGVYFNWSDCLAQVKGFKKATFKSFTSITDAEAFLAGKEIVPDPNSAAYGAQKFYAVQNGRVPGVYTDWPSAQQQITGWQKPKHRCFSTRAEAEQFVRAGKGGNELTGANQGGTVTQTNDAHIANMQSGLGLDMSNNDIKVPQKRQRKTNKAVATPQSQQMTPQSHLLPGTYGADLFDQGTAPLPSNVQDGFDPRMALNQYTGRMDVKSYAQLQRTIPQASAPKPDTALRIYTDGSSLGNGCGGAVAGIGVFFGDGDVRNVSEPLTGSRQTNNRAELTAILRALDIAPRNRDVCIFTDSNYSINCVTEWFPNWQRNNWTASNGKPVENRDLIEAILGRMAERRTLGAQTTYQWLKGHANDPGNIEADKLAVNGARNARG